MHELKQEIKQMNVREGFIRAKLEKERTITMQDPILKQQELDEIDEDFR